VDGVTRGKPADLHQRQDAARRRPVPRPLTSGRDEPTPPAAKVDGRGPDVAGGHRSGSSYVFESEVVGGSIPNAFIKPIEEGIKEALTHGVLSGYPIDDVRIELYDGSYHDVDSSETTFRIAGAMAFQDAAKRA
jgi:translation elongation factor EF-G